MKKVTFSLTFLWMPYEILFLKLKKIYITSSWLTIGKLTIHKWLINDLLHDNNVCYKRCRVIIWNEAELSYAHTIGEIHNRSNNSIVCQTNQWNGEKFAYITFSIPSWMPYEIKSFEQKMIEKMRTNWRYVDKPMHIVIIKTSQLTIDKLTICEWVRTSITFVSNDGK